MKRLILVGLAALLLAMPALAAKPLPSPEPFTLVSETSQNNPTSPTWCLNEDDYHQRVWSGSFSGDFLVSERFCIPGVDISPDGYAFWDGGGMGIHVELVAVGTLDSLTISVPLLTQDAVLTRTETVGRPHRQKTYNTYTACIFPSSENYPYGPLASTGSVSLSGVFSDARLQVTAEMFGLAELGWPSLCPEGQRP